MQGACERGRHRRLQGYTGTHHQDRVVDGHWNSGPTDRCIRRGVRDWRTAAQNIAPHSSVLKSTDLGIRDMCNRRASVGRVISAKVSLFPTNTSDLSLTG